MISQILPHLYVADEYHAVTYQIVDQLKIQTFLRLDKDAVYRNSWNEQTDRFTLKTVHLIDGIGNPVESFVEAVDYLIAQQEKNKMPMLVYCMAGMNRSPTICTLFVYKTVQQITWDETLKFMKKQHAPCNFDSEVFKFAQDQVMPLMKSRIIV